MNTSMQYAYSNRNPMVPKTTSTTSQNSSNSTLRGRTQSPAMSRVGYPTMSSGGATTNLGAHHYPASHHQYQTHQYPATTNMTPYRNNSYMNTSPSAAAVAAAAARRNPQPSRYSTTSTTLPNDFYLNRFNNTTAAKRIPVRFDSMASDYSSPPPYQNSSSKYMSSNLEDELGQMNLGAATSSQRTSSIRNYQTTGATKYDQDDMIHQTSSKRSTTRETSPNTTAAAALNSPHYQPTSQFFASNVAAASQPAGGKPNIVSSSASTSSTSSSSSSSSSSSASPPMNYFPNAGPSSSSSSSVILNAHYSHLYQPHQQQLQHGAKNGSGSSGEEYDDVFGANLAAKGLAGLKNLGNTCFMNSILQCVSNTRPLMEYCLRNEYAGDLNTSLSTMKGSLFKSFANVIKTMWKTNDIVVPSEMRSQIIRFAPKFVGYAQHDAEEFLNYLLKGLHEDVNLVKKKASIKFDEQAWDRMSDVEKSEEHWSNNLKIENSRISEIFSGQLKSTLKCMKCDHRSPTFEVFWLLPVPIPTKLSSIKLDDCIKLFMTEEILDGEDKPTCSKCKEKRRSAKRYAIERPPSVLVIQLKRFLRAHYTMQKIDVNVNYPLVLDMSKYLSKNVESSSVGNGSCLYDLYAISLHSGSGSSGHYVAFCKHPYTRKWHCFNDSGVREISEGSVQDPNAYILFYQLRSSS